MDIEKIDKKLLKIMLEVIEQRRKKAELKAIKEQAKREKSLNKSKGGRPKLKPEIIEKAKLLGQKYTLNEVAFRLEISVNSLYNHGISRNALN